MPGCSLEGHLHQVLGVPEVADEQDRRTQQSAAGAGDELFELQLLALVHAAPRGRGLSDLTHPGQLSLTVLVTGQASSSAMRASIASATSSGSAGSVSAHDGMNSPLSCSIPAGRA